MSATTGCSWGAAGLRVARISRATAAPSGHRPIGAASSRASFIPHSGQPGWSRHISRIQWTRGRGGPSK